MSLEIDFFWKESTILFYCFFGGLIFFKLSDGVFLYGNYAKNLMESEGIDSNKLHVIYNSLNNDLQLKIRKTLSPSEVFKDFFKNGVAYL